MLKRWCNSLPNVRFSLNMTPLRSLDSLNPLTSVPSKKLLDEFISRNNLGALWFLSLRHYFRLSVESDSTPEQQLELKSRSCQLPQYSRVLYLQYVYARGLKSYTFPGCQSASQSSRRGCGFVVISVFINI